MFILNFCCIFRFLGTFKSRPWLLDYWKTTNSNHVPRATIHYISNFATLVLVAKLLKFHEHFTAGLLDVLLLELLSGASKHPYFSQKIRGLRPLCSYTEVLAPGALPLNPAVRRPSARHALRAFLAVKLCPQSFRQNHGSDFKAIFSFG